MGPFFFLSGHKSRRDEIVTKTSRGIAAARRRGHNTYYGDWHFGMEADAPSVTSSVIGWCRETLASCRRPFGIDYFDLAVTVDGADGRPGRLSLQELRPGVLYATSLEERLADFLEKCLSACREGSRPLRVSTALFSWGDAAHEALPATL